MVVRVRLGERAVLECDPRGDQPLTVSWARHGQPLTPQPDQDLQVSFIQIDILL